MKGTDILTIVADLLSVCSELGLESTERQVSFGMARNTRRKSTNNWCGSGEIPFKNWKRISPNHIFPGDYDRIWCEDGKKYYGVDREDGTTDLYDEDGWPEGRIDTPSEAEQDENTSHNDGRDHMCPHCNGTGYDPYDGGQCEYCDGLGEVWDE